MAVLVDVSSTIWFVIKASVLMLPMALSYGVAALVLTAFRYPCCVFNSYLALWRTQMLGPIIKTSGFILIFPLSIFILPGSFLHGCAGGIFSAFDAAANYRGWWHFAEFWIREVLDEKILQKGMTKFAERQLDAKLTEGQEPWDINIFRAFGALIAALLGSIYAFVGFMIITVSLFLPGLAGGCKKLAEAAGAGVPCAILGFFCFCVTLLGLYPIYVLANAVGGLFAGAIVASTGCYVASKVVPEDPVWKQSLGFFGLIGIAKGMNDVTKMIGERGEAGTKMIDMLLK